MSQDLVSSAPGSSPLPTPEDMICRGWPDYAYLDSGDGRRLERFADLILDRPAPQAIWPKGLPAGRWSEAYGRFERRPDGSGDWEFDGPEPEARVVRWETLQFEVRPTGFGHLGLFPEQEPTWSWLQRVVRAQAAPPRVLNLFAYTGSSSLAPAAAGADVTHLDAVKGVVQWASDNARSSGLGEATLRWIVDDVQKFVAREQRRERRYEGILLDPPSFGRGKQGEVWKLEESLAGLLRDCAELLSEGALFLMVSAHTPGVTAAVLQNLLQPLRQARGGRVVAGEMLLAGTESPHILPSGTYARWEAESLA